MFLKDALKRERHNIGFRLLNEYGARVACYWKGETEVFWEKTIPVGLTQFPAQIFGWLCDLETYKKKPSSFPLSARKHPRPFQLYSEKIPHKFPARN
jgi:hypothetical protein